jgi:hypothetical protein
MSFVVCKYWEYRDPATLIDRRRTPCSVCGLDLVIEAGNLELGKPVCILCFLSAGGVIEITGDDS